MIIGGVKKISLIDYPNEISSVIFTQGCNMRCIYCHNSHLVLPERYSKEISIERVFDYLLCRKGKINAVVISGGEPTLHKDLPYFIKEIKNMGFLVKLDTNGTNPEMLKTIIDKNLVDFIAMDIKAPFEKYKKICGTEINTKKIVNSIEIIKDSSIEKEFRTTFVKKIQKKEDLFAIKEIICEHLTIHSFIFTSSILNNNLNHENELTESELQSIDYKVKGYK